MAFPYSALSWRFADCMKVRDPGLIRAFVRADLNVVLRGPTVRIGGIMNFISGKYNVVPEEAAEVAEIETLPRLLAITEEIMRRRPNTTPTSVTNVAIPKGYTPVCYHTMANEGTPIIPRSEWLVVAASEMSQRLRNATRVPPIGTQTVNSEGSESSTNSEDQREQRSDSLTDEEY